MNKPRLRVRPAAFARNASGLVFLLPDGRAVPVDAETVRRAPCFVTAVDHAYHRATVCGAKALAAAADALLLSILAFEVTQ